jgi:hypothetical protein
MEVRVATHHFQESGLLVSGVHLSRMQPLLQVCNGSCSLRSSDLSLLDCRRPSCDGALQLVLQGCDAGVLRGLARCHSFNSRRKHPCRMFGCSISSWHDPELACIAITITIIRTHRYKCRTFFALEQLARILVLRL